MPQILLTSFATTLEAHMLQDKLALHGIPSRISNEHSFYSGSPGHRDSVLLYIEEADLEAAKKLLLGKDQTSCPHCGSQNIRVSLGPTKLLRAINVFLALFLAMHIGNKNRMECRECNQKFNL